MERSQGKWPVLITGITKSRYRSDVATWCDKADSMVVEISEYKVSVAVNGKTCWAVEARCGALPICRPVISALSKRRHEPLGRSYE